MTLPAEWKYAGFHLDQANRSVNTDNGETDVDTKWTSEDGKSYTILCEVKLDAQFMDKQGQRYRERAETLVRSNKVTDAVTVLIAHSTYLRAANQEARYFDHWIKLDNLARWVRISEDSELGYFCISPEKVYFKNETVLAVKNGVLRPDLQKRAF